MDRIVIPFDETTAWEVALKGKPLEVALPEPLSEEVWEKLAVIRELIAPLPLIVAFSETWVEGGLEGILTRLAVTSVVGLSVKSPASLGSISQLNKIHRLGLFILSG